MNLQHVDIVFQLIVFLFAISVHESAHAWMANLRGDPTARMLGRISLNPIRHIDPLGTVLLPLIAMFFHVPVLGWAKPTPVDPRNFKNPVLDDVLTAVVGPASNFIVASCAVLVLAVTKMLSPIATSIILGLIFRPPGFDLSQFPSLVAPFCLLLYQAVVINVVLGVFNLIPVPPLDGSHVFRHLLPAGALRVYDTIGMFGLFVLVFWGGGLLTKLIRPAIAAFDLILIKI
jgi:Zn-dependent protease